MAWQNMALTKEDGLLITAGERKGRRQSNRQTQESVWRYRQGKAGTVYLEIGFSPALLDFFYLLLLLSLNIPLIKGSP